MNHRTFRPLPARFLLPVLALLLPLAAATAQEGGKPGAPPPAGVKKLSLFLGTWKGEAHEYLMKDTIPVAMTVRIEKTAGGYGLLVRSTGKMGSGGVYRETNLIGYDPAANEVRFFSITNTGQTKAYSGTWESDKDNTLNLTYKFGKIGTEYVERMTVILAKRNTMTIHNIATVNGKYHGMFEATLHR